ncbi:MAG: hypothetical protein PVI75_02255 [Gammaproteobacteria bacterium]|jgi:thymidylate kinase
MRNRPIIIEFTGPTGAGKTTISSNVIKGIAAKGYKVGVVHEKVKNSCPIIPESISNISKHNIKTDIIVFPWVVLFAFKHFRFFTFSLQKIFFCKETLKNKLAILRSFWRKVGIYDYIGRKKFKDWVIVFDEGVVHSMHNFLVGVNFVGKQEDIKFFTNNVPMPDILVVAKEDDRVLRYRALNRNNRSPRIKKTEDIGCFVTHANKLYDVFLDAKANCENLIVHNDAGNITDKVIFMLGAICSNR